MTAGRTAPGLACCGRSRQARRCDRLPRPSETRARSHGRSCPSIEQGKDSACGVQRGDRHGGAWAAASADFHPGTVAQHHSALSRPHPLFADRAQQIWQHRAAHSTAGPLAPGRTAGSSAQNPDRLQGRPGNGLKNTDAMLIPTHGPATLQRDSSKHTDEGVTKFWTCLNWH